MQCLLHERIEIDVVCGVRRSQHVYTVTRLSWNTFLPAFQPSTTPVSGFLYSGSKLMTYYVVREANILYYGLRTVQIIGARYWSEELACRGSSQAIHCRGGAVVHGGIQL